jgi:hypothetical protein
MQFFLRTQEHLPHKLISSASLLNWTLVQLVKRGADLESIHSVAESQYSKNDMPEERLESSRFSHRHNPDGSIDSICRSCFVTVATATAEGALAAYERAHVCNPWMLEHYKGSESSRQSN